jgi:deoxyribonuclease-4
MKYIGAHVSISGGVDRSPARAAELKANALGIFTKNQRRWDAKPLTEEQKTAFATALSDSGIEPRHVVIHASYLINLATPNTAMRRRSVKALLDECARAEQLGLTLVNFHPGSGLGEISEADALGAIADGVREILSSTTDAVLVLEGTAGQGDHVGWRMEHLAQIIDLSGGEERVAVCLDTCHAFAAGYDLATSNGYRSMIASLDATVGIDRLLGIHLNDSRFGLGSRRDRHAPIGRGEIGLPGLSHIVRDPALDRVPFILETPQPELWAAEIKLLRGIADGSIAPESAVLPAAAAEVDEG